MLDGPVWDRTNTTLQTNNIIFENPDEPLKNITKSTKTVKTSIKGTHQTLRREGERLIEPIWERH